MKPEIAAAAVATAVVSSLVGLAAIGRSGWEVVSRVHAIENDDDDRACTNASLRGSYGFYRTGSTSTGPLAAVGIIVFDGEGNATATQSISRNGVFTFDVTAPATYEVAEDCTGKEFLPNGVEFARLVVVDGGKGFYLFSETAGNTVYGVGTKIGRRKP
jgi:hypothetical protein